MASTDPLLAYKKKRDFALTSEPAGAVARKKSVLSFVIQKHAARSLHYDFRLELDGTLKSWAIPKGPSLDPTQKRLAVQVEDHPLSYAGFEGVIPPEQYGAGTVIVWDRGTWEPVGDARAGYRAGKLKFQLHGEKLKGGWTLVRMRSDADSRQKPWLLIKERDAEAKPASDFSVVDALPDSVLAASASRRAGKKEAAAAKPALPKAPAKSARQTKARGTPREAGTAIAPGALVGAKRAAVPLTLSPQLATLVDRAPEEDDWIYEIKYDGYRILARIDKADVRLFTRNGHDWTAKLRGLAAALNRLKLSPGWLDGEIVVLGKNGTPDFGALQNAFDDARTEQIQYFVFDLPFYAGFDLREVGLSERRALLASLLRESSSEQIKFSEDFKAKGSDVLHDACRLGLEGVIGKRRDSAYVSRRSANWIKLKCTQRQEFVVVGYTEPQGTRTGIGALLLGTHDQAGKLRYAGRVGTGFDTNTLTGLKKQLSRLAVDKTPLFEKPRDAQGNWVKPKLVAEVSFAEWTNDGKVRQAVFHGLRTDKPATAITRESAADAPDTAARARDGTPAPGKRKAAGPAEIGGVRITHPDRIIDPSTGLTKLDLVNYYAQVAKRILPHLVRRPVSLLRAPAGIQHQLFIQKHGDTLKIPGLKELDPAFDPEHPPLLEIDSLKALIGAAQMNVVEFHTWNATTRSIEKPDRMTFDLDPAEGLAWPLMLEAAQLVRTFLDELGLQSFLKTSGGKGLHVVVPLTPRDDWETVKEFSKQVVQHIATDVPARFVSKSGPRTRLGKVFIDYLRNGRGATTVAAFSARARPGMGVSMPCSWKELPSLTGGAQWTIVNAHERLEAGADPWAGYAKTRQTLTAAMRKLGLGR
ncbi:MAG: DNA ligase D [Chloroflexi bacterium]|nr:DNA ligase D [Chloroflexota bacterium]